jgi:nicotinamidase-related amidase
MKALFTVVLFTLSLSSFANTAKLIEACRSAGVEKILLQDSHINPASVKECGVDSRVLNPSKYVWFCAKNSQGKTITVLTQKSLFSDCF